MSSSSSSRRDQGTAGGGPPVKVRVIVTKFVEVDAREFKSAVQHLTGKDSVAAEATTVKAEAAEDRGLVCRFGTTRAADHGRSFGGLGRKQPLEFVPGFEQVLQREEEEEEDAELILSDALFEFLRD